MDLDRIFCLKEKRQVQGDHAVSYKARKYQILPTKRRFGFAKAKVEVHRRLGGSIHVFYKGEELPCKAIIPVEEEGYTNPQKEPLAVGV
jgi:hypothetical protein